MKLPSPSIKPVNAQGLSGESTLGLPKLGLTC
jgi:hypothetical protein